MYKTAAESAKPQLESLIMLNVLEAMLEYQSIRFVVLYTVTRRGLDDALEESALFDALPPPTLDSGAVVLAATLVVSIVAPLGRGNRYVPEPSEPATVCL